jgi:hypothetical protein
VHAGSESKPRACDRFSVLSPQWTPQASDRQLPSGRGLCVGWSASNEKFLRISELFLCEWLFGRVVGPVSGQLAPQLCPGETPIANHKCWEAYLEAAYTQAAKNPHFHHLAFAFIDLR